MPQTKEQKKAYYQKWYQEHREELLAKQKERNKRNYQKNKERYKQKHLEWRNANPERQKELTKAWAETHKERMAEISRKHYQMNKEKELDLCRQRKLKSYGLTQQDYEMMADQQNNRCAICQTELVIHGKKKTAYVDHCHATGKVRGLLCMKCNSMLGMAGDNVETLKAAIDYLNRSSGAT